MTESLPARGFGPGLPPEGASLTARMVGDRLLIRGWVDIEWVRRGQLRARRQGRGILLEWAGPVGACALALDEKHAAAVTAWLPAEKVRTDRATVRWLWGALFLLVGLPMLLVAVFLGFRAEIVDAAVARIPVEGEKQLGEELWKLQRHQLRLVENTAANRFIEATGARLTAGKPSQYSYHFHLADEGSINAFAMPAGHVVVHRGLIEKAQSAEEVAGVLAHEIEHVEQRHSLRGLVQEVGLAAIWMAVTGDVGSSAAGSWLKDLAGLEFSREQETAADTGGYQRLLSARIDPRGMISFFERLAEEQGALPTALSWLSTHPASAERSARLKTLLQDAPAFPPLAADWKAIQASASRK